MGNTNCITKINVLGSEKVRFMERKMKNKISPLAKTLQNELCLTNPVKRYNRLKLKVNIAPNVTYVFQTALLKNDHEIMCHKPYFLRAYHK